MDIKVYVITDVPSIELIEDNDYENFKKYLLEDDTIIFHEPKVFHSEQEATAFCDGIEYNLDERAPLERIALRSDKPDDRLFIEAIENY